MGTDSQIIPVSHATDEDGRALATPRNMRLFEAQNAGAHAVALDTCTNERFSANSGDYFAMGDDEPMVSVEDRETPLVLVREPELTYRDAITGKVLGDEANGDDEQSNAARGAAAVRAGSEADVPESEAIDTIANILHFVAQSGDVERTVRLAVEHFENERA